MKNRLSLAIFLFSILVSVCTHAIVPESVSARQIVERMLHTLMVQHGAQFTMDATERQVGKPEVNNHTVMLLKVNMAPLRIYGKILKDPNKNVELLYVTGEHGGKIRVNPGKFLPTLSLSVTSGLLTKNQHHTLLTSGFATVTRIVADGVKRADSRGEFDKVFSYQGELVYHDRKCYKIVIVDPTFVYTTARGMECETVVAMADRLLISPYHIMEMNSSYRSLDDNVSGKALKVPSAFAQKATLYIDEQTNIPLYQEMTDDRGMFEKYEYSNVISDPPFKSDEFSEKFSEYKF